LFQVISCPVGVVRLFSGILRDFAKTVTGVTIVIKASEVN